MGYYTTALIGMVGIGLILTVAVVFALLRPNDLPAMEHNNR